MIIKNCYQSTKSGVIIDLLNPTPDMFLIEDIAASLSKICRFTGHCDRFYSVAEHSLNGAKALHSINILWAYEFLLHDAHEAYVGDLHTNLKKICPDYQHIEQEIDRIIRKKFGLPLDMTPEVKKMDLIMLATEKRDIMKQSTNKWGILKDINPLPEEIQKESPSSSDIEELFLNTFNNYQFIHYL